MNEQSFGAGFNTGTALDTIKGFQTWKKQETDKSNFEQTNNKINDGKIAYQCSLNSTDKDLKSRYVSLSNLHVSEAAIQQLAQSRGNHEYDGLGTGQIMCQFTKKNPKLEKINNDMLDNKIGVDYWAKRIGMEKYLPKDESVEDINIENTESVDEPSVWQNIAQGPIDTILGPGKLLFEKVDEYVAKPIVSGAARLLGMSEEDIEKNNAELEQVRENVGNIFGADRDSLSYILSNLGSDLGITVASNFVPVPGVGAVKDATFVAKLANTAPKLINTVKKILPTAKSVEEFSKKYPVISDLLTKAVKSSSKMAKEGTVMRTLDAEGTDAGDLTFDALFGAVMPILGKMGNAITDKVKFTGIVNNNQLKKVTDTLDSMGTYFEGGKEALSRWMDDFKITGTTAQMINKLTKLYETSKAVVDELASSINKTYKVPIAQKVINDIKNLLIDEKTGLAKTGLEDALKEIETFIAKGDMFTPKDLRAVQNMIIEWFKPFKESTFDELAGNSATKKGILNAYKDIKGELEKIFKDEGLGDVAKLNNTTAVAYGLKNALKNKGKSEIAQSILPAGATAIITALYDGDFGKAAKFGVPLMLMTPYARTRLSRVFRSMQGSEYKNVLDMVSSKGKEILSNSELKRVTELLKSDDGIWNKFVNDFPKFIEEASKAGLLKGGEYINGEILN